MATSGAGFSMADFLGAISATVRPSQVRPLVVHANELETIPAGQVHNPTTLAIAGRLPTATFELFRQTIPAGQSSDMQRHYHETVHFVISGRGHSEIEDEAADWATGDFIYTPPWTWHRHYNDSAAGIVCRNSSNVAVGSFPAIASVVGLWTWLAGMVSSSFACTTSGRAWLGRTEALIAPRKSAMLNPAPEVAIRSSPSARHRP